MNGVITVQNLADFYLVDNRPVGIVVTNETVFAQAIKAVKYYVGYGDLELFERKEDIVAHTELTPSEVAVISPLFELYVERENALILESSRSLGVEVYGRTISEISGDITQKELEIQNLAFQHDFFSVG